MSAQPPKKLKKSGDESVAGQDLDPATERYLEQVDLCQIEIDNLNVKAAEEVLEIEQKYNQLRKPHFLRRSEIVKNIPNFWITAIMNHPDLSTIIDDSEEDCLHHLNKIEVQEFDDIKSGYRIDFFFDENPFFENAVLSKEFHLDNENPTSQSTPIEWKEGVRLGRNVENNAGKSSRKRRLENERKSFFSWFSDNVDPTSDDIAEAFKDDLWLSPLQYYLVPDMQESNNMDEDSYDSENSDTDDDLDADD